MNEPIFTSVYPDFGQLQPAANSLYVTGTSVEERSHHTSRWESRCSEVTFARVVYEHPFRAIVSMGGEEVATLRLRSLREIVGFLDEYSPLSVYLDITGLEHRVWAPLLRGIRTRSNPAFCVYVEPGDYRFSSSPTEATIFDLSESIQGIEPLPGFASISGATDEDALFVPILGFEGARFSFALESVQPDRERIHPIIGVPGFRPEYPFYSYLGNRLPLQETRGWQNVRYAPANCPFSLYQVLSELAESNPGRPLKVAPIGTKPHGLGALLYYLDHSSTTEILYDHPIRKARRTVGASRACVYDLSLLPAIRPERGARTYE